jgi:hypothetical protein
MTRAAPRLLLVLVASLLLTACGATPREDAPVHRMLLAREVATTSPRASFLYMPASQFAAVDQAWTTRVDISGDQDLRPLVLEPGPAFQRAHPTWKVAADHSWYGKKTNGVCIGQDEVSVLHAYIAPTIWGNCQNADIQLLWLPIAHGAWLVVGDRNSMRPAVADFVDAVFDAAPANAAQLGLGPLTPTEVATSHAKFHAFVDAAHARGVIPMDG